MGSLCDLQSELVGLIVQYGGILKQYRVLLTSKTFFILFFNNYECKIYTS
jgi:hypothetical protein